MMWKLPKPVNPVPVERKVNATLRDQFAMAALSAVIIRSGGMGSHIVAKMAYEYADEMLKERSK